jgi:hypothetical protein
MHRNRVTSAPTFSCCGLLQSPLVIALSLGEAVKHKAELVICNRSLRELLFINRFSATALMPDGYLPYEGLF